MVVQSDQGIRWGTGLLDLGPQKKSLAISEPGLPLLIGRGIKSYLAHCWVWLLAIPTRNVAEATRKLLILATLELRA